MPLFGNVHHDPRPARVQSRRRSYSCPQFRCAQACERRRSLRRCRACRAPARLCLRMPRKAYRRLQMTTLHAPSPGRRERATGVGIPAVREGGVRPSPLSPPRRRGLTPPAMCLRPRSVGLRMRRMGPRLRGGDSISRRASGSRPRIGFPRLSAAPYLSAFSMRWQIASSTATRAWRLSSAGISVQGARPVEVRSNMSLAASA